jgi:peptidyl-prolyl cis-trans isomerase D
MLRGIQKASSGWLGRSILGVVMGLIAISFAIWGIGDIFRGFGSRTLATIGGTDIGIEQFRYYYSDKINQLGRRVGRVITPDQARALGIDRQIVGELVAETTLDEKAKQLKLGVSDSEISRRIMSDPAFQGVNGQFDRNRFIDLIRNAGYTEQRFVQEQRQVMLRRQLALSLTGDFKVPLAAQNALNLFQNEKRSADVVLLGEAQAGEIAAPTPEVLQQYFEERKALFRAPETRKVVLLSLTPAEQARWSTVSDEDARAYYEQRKAEYGTPEKRHLRQIVFPNPSDAAAAADKIAKGATFDDIIKDRELKESDVDLSVVAKTEVIDPAVADAAFALKQGETSAPVTGRFGTSIVQVKEIQPGRQQPYEEVAATIKNTIATSRARTEIAELRDKIEDERAAGSTLAETAAKLKLASRTIEAVDRSGRDSAGSVVPEIAQNRELLAAIFNSDVGADSEPVQVQGGGFVWFDVVSVTRSRERNLDEVKAQVETRWKNDEIAARLKTKADEMVAAIKSGTPIAKVAADNQLKVESVADLQRNEPKPPVSGAALQEIFQLAKGAPGTAEGDAPATRLVFVVTAIEEPKLEANAPEASQIAQTLERSYTEDMLAQYVAKLESEIGVYINQGALQQIVGGGTVQ